MQTRNALRKLGGPARDWVEGPLADIAQALVEAHSDREAARMADAQFRADTMGAGPHLAALQRIAREVAAQSLVDNTAPAIMRADMHALLKAASKGAPTDSGLRRAATHAYRLFGKDPQGVLTVGDVARLRDHYKREYPRSQIAAVIERDLPKVGFNTLPVPRLTRIATEIATHCDAENADLQFVYEAVMQREGLVGNKPEQMRARAYVRGLLESAEDAATENHSDVAGRTLARMASHGDPILSRVGQQLDPDMDDATYETEPADDLAAEEPSHDEGAEETATVTSPITGDDLVLELGVDEEPAEEDLGTNDVDVVPQGVGGLDVMGQLEDMMGDDDDLDAPRGDVQMGPDSNETVAVIPDPSDPEGGDLEVTLRPIEEEPDMVGDPAAEDEVFEAEASAEEDPMEFKQSFVVYAYSDGQRGTEPLETFTARGMAAALKRIAGYGVKGEIRSTPEALHQEALIVLDADKGTYLSVQAADKKAPEKGTSAIESPPDGINAQQPDYMSGVDADGAKQLKSDNMGSQNHPHRKKSKTEIIETCAKLNITASDIENRVLDGEVVKIAGWAIGTNNDDNIELRNGDGSARTASLLHLDDVIANFMAHVAQAQPEPAPAPVVKAAYYDVTDLFSVRCAGCGSINEYAMPETADDADCGCGHTTTAAHIAASFGQGNPVSGYILVSDVPDADNDKTRQLHARRMLAAIKKIVPDAHGLLRKDAKLEVSISADAPALNRVKKVLEQQYGIQAFHLHAQAIDSMGQPTQDATSAVGTGANPSLRSPTAPPVPAPVATPPAAGDTAYVGPPQAPGVQPTAPEAQPGVTARAAFVVEYKGADGQVGSTPVDAETSATARAVFARFNPNVEIVKVGQLAGPDPMMAPAEPGGPEGGGEEAPLPVEDQLGGPAPDPMADPMGGGADMFGSGNLNPEEMEAVGAVALSLRQDGIGPLDGANKLHSKLKPLLDQYGDTQDFNRHLMEAEVMKALAEAWMKPVVLQPAGSARGRMAAGPKGPSPSGINTQQPGYLTVSNDLGPDSETDDGATNTLEAPTVNTQVDTIATQPGAVGADTSTQPDTETNDPGDFGAGKPKAQHPATDQQGVSLPPTDLGQDSDTGDNSTTKKWDGVPGTHDRSQ